jgi:hypothetical protein
MSPAHQGLETRGLPGFKVEDGLVAELELTAIDGDPEFCLEFEAVQGASVHGFVKQFTT